MIIPKYDTIEILDDTHLTRIVARCKVCGNEWITTKQNIQKSGCLNCYKFNNKAKWDEKFNALLDKANLTYNKGEALCKICGNAWQTTRANLQFTPHCVFCNKKRVPNLHNAKQFALNKNIKILETLQFKSKDKIKCECTLCGFVWDSKWAYIINDNRCPRCAKHISRAENEVGEMLKNYDFLKDVKGVVKGDLDYYIPAHKIAIEYDGLYWHSEKCGKGYSYHLQKTKDCEAQGIKLFHIWENEWLEKREIWQSVIYNALGKSTKLYARDCYCFEIPNDVYKNFCENNHLQGYSNSIIRIGLFYHNTLFAVMGFGKARFNSGYEYELIRFCTKLKYRIIGGGNKLLRYFIRNYRPKSIISYANRRWASIHHNLYKSLGFTLLHETSPNYWYFKGRKLFSRLRFQKHKLKNMLQCYDESLSEADNMRNNGYNRIFDCGNLTYILELNNV